MLPPSCSRSRSKPCLVAPWAASQSLQLQAKTFTLPNCSTTQALQLQLPAGLHASLPMVAQRPLQLLLERLLARHASTRDASAGGGDTQGSWLEAVLAAYMAAVVLRRAPGPQQAAAERALLATLAGLQQTAAVQGLLHGAAQQAAAVAATDLKCRNSDRHSSWIGAGALAGAEQRSLLEEALQQLTSSALETLAAAQLLLHYAEQQQAAAAVEPAARNAEGTEQALEEQPAPGTLGGLLHSPPTMIELELLCLVVLLPCWEATLRRLARLEGSAFQPADAAADSTSSSSGECTAAGSRAVEQALQLLCTACTSQAEAMLQLHPALPAEVCRRSFSFTCCYAALLEEHQRQAEGDTRTAREAARWRVVHAAKHDDHVTSYLLAKGCTL